MNAKSEMLVIIDKELNNQVDLIGKFDCEIGGCTKCEYKRVCYDLIMPYYRKLQVLRDELIEELYKEEVRKE